MRISLSATLCSYVFCLTWLLRLAAAADCGAATPTTITDFPALGDIARCTSYGGDVLIQSITFSPDSTPATPTLTLGGLATVAGSVQFSNIKVQSGAQRRQQGPAAPGNPSGDNGLPVVAIKAPDLTTVYGTLRFSDLTEVALSMPSLPNLFTVQALEWSAVNFGEDAILDDDKLPILTSVQSISFSSTDVERIDLSSDGASLADVGVEIMLSNNNKLTNVSIGRFDKNMAVHIDSNDAHPVVTFPYLASATLALRGVKSFMAPSLESLSAVETASTPDIAYNTFETLSLPQLKRISGSMSIEDNDLLTNLDLPKLEDVGSLDILGNSQLARVNIESPRVTGDVTIDSSSPFKCQSLRQQIPGLDCSATSETSSTTSSSNPMSNAGSGGLSSSAKIGVGVGVGVGAALLLIGAAVFFCYRRHGRGSDQTPEISTATYSKSQDHYNGGSEVSYAQVPYHVAPAAVVTQPRTEEPTPTSAEAHRWTTADRNAQSTKGLMELEEQQGTRHEMDARSLQGLDSDEDDEAETRSLEDIERIHGQR